MKSLTDVTITEIVNTMVVRMQKGYKNKMENRKCYGLSFSETGRVVYTHKGKKFVSDGNCVIIIPQGQSYTIEAEKQGAFPLINFHCMEHLTDTFLVFPSESISSFMSDFKKINDAMLFSENRTKAMSIFYNMLHTLLSGAVECKIIAPAIKYIENNYKNADLTNEVLAAECNISEVYLRKLFNKYLKTTPKQYISEIRLQKAKQLLSDELIKINAVAEECGFSSQYHFSRFFKDRTGITPTEYATRNKVYKI